MSGDTTKLLFQLGPLLLLILLMYFMLIRPQKKKEKEVTAMRSALQVGDSIITIGGICGKVAKVKDDTLVIQVGADKIKFEIMKWAISQVVAGKGTKLSSKDTDATADEGVAKPKRLKKSESAKNEVVDVEVEPVKKEKDTDTKEEAEDK